MMVRGYSLVENSFVGNSPAEKECNQPAVFKQCHPCGGIFLFNFTEFVYPLTE